MRFLAPSPDEIRAWGHCFDMYPGATATGSSESNLRPLSDGGLSAAIPLEDARRVKRLCDTAGLDPTNLDSDGSPINRFQAVKLGVTGYKFETSFRGAVKWLTTWNLQFLEEVRVFSLISAEAYLGSSITSSVEEVSPLVDKLIGCESPLVPNQQVFALHDAMSD
jgi:hypothetical protein